MCRGRKSSGLLLVVFFKLFDASDFDGSANNSFLGRAFNTFLAVTLGLYHGSFRPFCHLLHGLLLPLAGISLLLESGTMVMCGSGQEDHSA